MGQPARIKVESFRDRLFYGKVTKIAPMGVEKDNVTTFEVRVSINNPGGELKANMTANAEILLDEHKGVLTVPEKRRHYDGQKNASVQIPDKKQKEGWRKVPVKVGFSNGSVTEIVSGLKEGDQVVQCGVLGRRRPAHAGRRDRVGKRSHRPGDDDAGLVRPSPHYGQAEWRRTHGAH
jgi:HlyD family secretion protein